MRVLRVTLVVLLLYGLGAGLAAWASRPGDRRYHVVTGVSAAGDSGVPNDDAATPDSGIPDATASDAASEGFVGFQALGFEAVGF